MSNARTQPKTALRRLVEAAAWRRHLTEMDLESSEEFEAWLAADSDNRNAWERVQESWDFIGKQATAPELLEIRRAALAHARNVGRKRWNSGSRRGWRRATVAAGIGTLFLSALIIWNHTAPDVYRTGAGERRVVRLADGSQVQLDSLTELRVDYTKRARELALTYGQVRFDVAHDVERPFTVTAAQQKVVATGTAFNLDLLNDSLFVTLIEGRVLVLSQRTDAHATLASGRAGTAASAQESRSQGLIAEARNARRPIALAAGEQLIVTASGATRVARGNAEHATAWQSGQLVFENEPLRAVIPRVNRYTKKTLSLGDERIAELRISGVFNTGDIDGFVSTITSYLPVDANEAGDSILLTHR